MCFNLIHQHLALLDDAGLMETFKVKSTRIAPSCRPRPIIKVIIVHPV